MQTSAAARTDADRSAPRADRPWAPWLVLGLTVALLTGLMIVGVRDWSYRPAGRIRPRRWSADPRFADLAVGIEIGDQLPGTTLLLSACAGLLTVVASPRVVS